MSFFGKKTKQESGDVRSFVASTGGKVDDLVAALIRQACDESDLVCAKVADSITEIGRKLPELVISSLLDFIKKEGKGNQKHLIVVLGMLCRLLEQHLNDISETLGLDLVRMAMGEMTRDKNVQPELQGPPSEILVVLGRRFPQAVWNQLTELFPPGQIPHYFVMKTMGDLAVTNPLEIVPHLKEVMARTLPILAQIKKDNIRWVFSATFGHWCEAVIVYLANMDKASDQSIKLETFSSEVFPAYELMVTQWINSGESKVRLATALAIGNICSVMAHDQFEGQIQRILPAIIGLYKKERNHTQITQSVTLILSAATKNDDRMLDPHVQNIMAVLHQLVCVPGIFDNPETVKNANELLRCFEILGRVFTDTVVTWLLARLDPVKVKDIRVRAGTLNIIRHIVNRLDDVLGDKKDTILSGVKPLIDVETSLEVKKVLAQVVIGMASQGYLKLEGGESLLEFIVRHCAIKQDEIDKFEQAAKKLKEPPEMSPAKMRMMCDNILNLATTTVQGMDQVLWPYLFEFIVPSKYTEALPILCKCLGAIAQQKRESHAEDYMIDFDKEVNLPKPVEILARLMVMLNSPLGRGNLGVRIIELLQGIGPLIRSELVAMWDAALPKLKTYLENNANTDSWDLNTWEDLILRLLSETVKIIGDEKWTAELGESYSAQLTFYSGTPDLRKSALKHLGLILQKSSGKDFVKGKLDMIFDNTNHHEPLERQGCAQAYGFCAASHLDMVLEKLKEKAGLTGSSAIKQPNAGGGGFFSGLFSSGSGGGGAPSNKLDPDRRNTVFLTLGYIAAYGTPSLVISRMNSHILVTMEDIMKNVKTIDGKENVIKCIDLIGKALHPSHLQNDEFRFKKRDEFVEVLISYMTTPETNEHVKVLGLNACSTLIHLEPALTPEIEKKLIESTMVAVFDPPVNKQTKKQDAPSQLHKDNFNEMLAAIVFMDTTTLCLGRILDYLARYLTHANSETRLRCVETEMFLLKKFVEFKSQETGPKVEQAFETVGKHLAQLIPRCVDPEGQIREVAMEAVEDILFIDHFLRISAEEAAEEGAEEKGYNLVPPEILAASPALRRKILASDVHEQFSIMHQMGMIIAKMLQDRELPLFLTSLLKGLMDAQVSSSSGTCVVLNGVIKTRGNVLENAKVVDLVDGMLQAMANIKEEKTMNGTLHSLRTMATHHLLPVLERLLQANPPHEPNVVKSLQAIAKDPNLVTQVIDHITDVLNNSQVQEDIVLPGGKVKEGEVTHSPHALSATCALGEILEIDEMVSTVMDNYAQILSTLLLRFGTTRYSKNAVVADQMISSFKSFIKCASEEKIDEALLAEGGWEQLKSNDRYHLGITTIVRAVCKSHPDEMKNIYEFILPYLQGNFTGQRIVTATVFAEMVSHVKDDRELLQNLVNNLLAILVVDNLKWMSLRGLSNIADAGKDSVNKFSSTVIDALMCNIDSEDENLAMEAMNGLSRVFELVDESNVAPILVNICHRIRPAFEKKSEEIRAASFQLFGSLYRFGNESGAQVFYEQIHHNLPCVMLHITDPCVKVQVACKIALKRLGKLMRAADVEKFLSDVLIPERNLNYPEFLNRFSALLIEYFPERLNYYVMTCIEYFKSDWQELRIGAVAFVGYALGNVPPDRRNAMGINPSIVASAVIGLFKQKSPLVRSQAAVAMSFMWGF